MLLGTPIQFTLYGDDDEALNTYRRARLPVMFAERAIELSNTLEGDSISQDQMTVLYQLIVDFYGNQFAIEDLKRGSIISELITVLKAICARAIELMPIRPNPTPPGM